MLKYLVAALLVSSAAFGQEIKGKAIALDGGTLLVTQDGGGKAVTVKIWGLDAPEMKIWPWGPRARGTLDLFLRSHERGVVCERRENAGNQILAKCRLIPDSGGNDLDVGAIMIRSGYAVEDRVISKGVYQDEEETAWRNNLGVWAKFWAK
jgi:endonuclease YncB( thermonuclease family)